MLKQLRISISPLTNGILGTNELDEQTYYAHPMEAIQSIVVNDGLKEFITSIGNETKYDVTLSVKTNDGDLSVMDNTIETEEERIEAIRVMRERVVTRDVYSPFSTVEVSDSELRLSVNSSNAYSADKLKKIDFNSLFIELGITNKRASELVGDSEQSIYQILRKVKNGTATYSFKSTRVKMTIIAKYMESVSGLRYTKKEELDRIREVISREVETLDKMIRSNNHIHTSTLSPLRDTLKSLL
jgi:hypothetical protein